MKSHYRTAFLQSKTPMGCGLWGFITSTVLITTGLLAQENSPQDTLTYVLQPPIQVTAKMPEYPTEANYKITPGRMIHVEFGKLIAKVFTLSKGEVEIFKNHLFVHPLKDDDYPVSYHVLFVDGSSFVLRLDKGGKREPDYFRVIFPEVVKEAPPVTGPVMPPTPTQVPSEDIRTLMIAMYNDYPALGGYKRVRPPKEVPYRLPGNLVRQGLKAWVIRAFFSPSLYGYVLQISMDSHARLDSVLLHERDLFVPGVRGIAMTQRKLHKGESLYVLIASSRPLVDLTFDEKR